MVRDWRAMSARIASRVSTACSGVKAAGGLAFAGFAAGADFALVFG
jgi:hypothetical protein